MPELVPLMVPVFILDRKKKNDLMRSKEGHKSWGFFSVQQKWRNQQSNSWSFALHLTKIVTWVCGSDLRKWTEKMMCHKPNMCINCLLMVFWGVCLNNSYFGTPFKIWSHNFGMPITFAEHQKLQKKKPVSVNVKYFWPPEIWLSPVEFFF